MRKLIIFGVSAAAVTLAAASLMPGSANAMTAASPAQLGTAADAGLAQPAAYVCRIHPWGRRCFWRPGPYYGAYGAYGWYRPWGWRHGWAWHRGGRHR